MDMNPIPHQPAAAFAGWFSALKKQGTGWGFLVLTLEGPEQGAFVQIVSDEASFLIDHPTYSERQRARREKVLEALDREGLAVRDRARTDTLLANLPADAEAAAAVVTRLFAKVFGAGPDARYEIEWGEFAIKPGNSGEDESEGEEAWDEQGRGVGKRKGRGLPRP